MNQANLKMLLREYEQKRSHKIAIAELKKEKIYSENNSLTEIDKELSNLAISTAKSLLSNPSKQSLIELNNKINILKNKKNTILNSLGLDNNSFEPDFDCKLCKDTGYVSDGYNTSMCSCLKQKLLDLEYNSYNTYNMQNQNFSNFSLDVYSDKINEEKYNYNISPKDNIKLIKNIVDNFIVNFDNENEKNLLFTGNSGLGKTFLSNCIANKLLENGKTVMYQTAPVMLDSIINYKLDKNKNSLNIYDNLLNVDLLIIDDLGTENLNNMTFAELFNILNSRLLRKQNKVTKTIISTNLDLKQLSELYGERIISRLIGDYNICQFFGDDIRFKNK